MDNRGILGLLVGILFAATVNAQQWERVQRFQGSTSEVSSVGLDAAQNIYLAGTFTGTNYLGSLQLYSATGDNLFVAKLDSTGQPLWAITANGSLSKMLVSGDGAVFLCGNLTLRPPAAPTLTSNLLLARLDEGVLTWAAASETNSSATIGFGPDASIYLLQATTQLVVRRFAPTGMELPRFGVPHGEGTLLKAIDIAVRSADEVFVLSRKQLNESGNYKFDVVAKVDSAGAVAWSWTAGGSSGYGWDRVIKALAVTPDGGVVAVGFNRTSMPESTARVIKFSSGGEEQWEYLRGGYRKTFYEANAVAVDSRGLITVAGAGARTYYNNEQLWLVTLGADGTLLDEELVRSYLAGHRNTASSLAIASDDSVFIAGTTQGEPEFPGWTNKPISLSPNGLVAHRIALPVLTRAERDGMLVLTWPVTGALFGLQKSEPSTGNWRFVSTEAQRVGSTYEVTLPLSEAQTEFRLWRTNAPPANQPPRWFWGPTGPNGVFLGHTNVVIQSMTGTTSITFEASAEDREGGIQTVTWFGPEPLTNTTSLITKPRVDDWDRRYDPWFKASLQADTDTFPPGFHSVYAVIFDREFAVTNQIFNFEVITFATALGELGAELRPYATNAWGRLAAKLFSRAEQAIAREDLKLAADRLRRLGKHLQNKRQLVEPDRVRFISAVRELEAVLRSE